MNWGYKLLCTFIVFIGGMGFLVYRSMSTEFQLVEKEYYKKELNYQTVIDGQHKANSLSMPVKVTSKDAEVVLEMPSELKGAVISGRVWFYCANDASKDKLSICLSTAMASKYLLPDFCVLENISPNWNGRRMMCLIIQKSLLKFKYEYRVAYRRDEHWPG